MCDCGSLPYRLLHALSKMSILVGRDVLYNEHPERVGHICCLPALYADLPLGFLDGVAERGGAGKTQVKQDHQRGI